MVKIPNLSDYECNIMALLGYGKEKTERELLNAKGIGIEVIIFKENGCECSGDARRYQYIQNLITSKYIKLKKNSRYQATVKGGVIYAMYDIATRIKNKSTALVKCLTAMASIATIISLIIILQNKGLL